MENHSTREPLARFERSPDPLEPPPWRQSKKVKFFVITSGLVLLLGLVVTALQPVVYRSSATVLMSAPVAIDAAVSEANTQNVAIQRTILLGEEITSRVMEQMAEIHAATLDASYLREVLRVDTVPDTNLIAMVAQGADKELLPDLVNRWIEVYSGARAEDIEQRKGHTEQLVQDELDGLAIKIEQARDALELYRVENNIVSAKREENEVSARLDGLNKALNAAVEEEVKTKAYLETLQESISRGQAVGTKNDMRSLKKMEKQLEQLRVDLIEMNKRYTTEYIQKQPALRATPERIAELEAEIAARRSEMQAVELASAEQAHSAARRAVLELQQKLDQHQRNASEFNRVYATHEALVEDLAGLEELNREAQERLVQVQVRQVDKYPQVSVIERAGTALRIGPQYLILLGGTLVAALACGILVVWLYGFLGRDISQPAYVTLSGVHLYPQEVSGELAYTTQADPRLAQSEKALLQDGGGAEDSQGGPRKPGGGAGENPGDSPDPDVR